MLPIIPNRYAEAGQQQKMNRPMDPRVVRSAHYFESGRGFDTLAVAALLHTRPDTLPFQACLKPIRMKKSIELTEGQIWSNNIERFQIVSIVNDQVTLESDAGVRKLGINFSGSVKMNVADLEQFLQNEFVSFQVVES
ncbi:hypothetical protein C7T94_15455 [Pedobacter yulinensis]|uniref:Uncharacterized protein n=2 Tax=Pedobacter yulinensis TaxID=2126353 RepID=A0A2T3HIC1_9SPHI|nr:hypothetical protein C7T94_15455 [Pedobacter yulinensis]